MTILLREVLHAFEEADRPLSLTDMARALDIAPGTLEGMIDYWVRKGKIRECSSGSMCESCGCAKSCAYSPNMPRRYELVTDESAESDQCCCH
jgi:hypothetical protein